MADRSTRTRDTPTQTGNIWPPPLIADETDAERARRVEKELEARRISDAIDQAIDLDRAERRTRKAATKILLLGQAESGKSTILKNFQLLFAPKSFYAEVDAWKAVIHLNLVRSVNFVLDLLENPSSSRRTSSSAELPRSPNGKHKVTSNDLRFLKMRLAPLREVEQILTRRLCPPDIETDASGQYHKDRASEVCVRGLSGWKTLLKNRRNPQNPAASDDLDDSQRVIEACKDDMTSLWEDPVVQAALKKHNVRLQDQSGFFLSDVARISSKNYIPTPGEPAKNQCISWIWNGFPDDILHARLQTLGVEEHRLLMETEAEHGKEWLIYDVGGSKGQRAVWAPFLDDVNVVIFLAPISVFNQSLAEDKKISRLHDCFELWKQICGNPLLGSAEFVLLLNKTDILEAKLKSGTKFSKYVPSYKGQRNDLEHVSQYLKEKYVSIHRQLRPTKPKPRKMYTHLTCAIDTRATSVVLSRVRDVILVNNLSSTHGLL